jgi:ribonuclease R
VVSEDDVLAIVHGADYRQMRTEELARALRVPEGETAEFVALLEALERRGQIVRVKKKHWVNPETAGLVTGRLQGNSRGFGFVLPLAEEAEDIYVAEDDLRDAMDGDLVVVEVNRKKPKGGGGRPRRKLGPSGRIIKVIDHRHSRLIGSYVPGPKFARVVPDNPRLFRDVYVPRADGLGAKEHDQVLVELTAWPSRHRNPEGEVKEVLGKVGTPGVDVKSVIFEFDLPREFPEAVLEAAAAIPRELPEAELQSRRDLRGQTTLTIDPEDAKDFDDALAFGRDQATGRRVVYVHIADLSYHVTPDSVLDQEARRRATSVYLANEVVPMLPHEQSKRVLSVTEGDDRPAKTVTLHFDAEGDVVDYSICHSVVNVDRCMSYTEVQEVLDAADSDEPAAMGAVERLPENVWETLRELDALAQQVKARRQEVGSVDLDVPDYHVSIGEDGRVVGVSQIVRDRSHGLVEEFMLAANRAVADYLRRRKLPGLFRVHDEPTDEDLEEFETFVRTVLHRKVDARDRRQLQDLLAEVAGSHVADAVNMQLLRSMQRALYSPSCKPHYALHFDRYCHFTSPVRRYPDLVVHQILDQAMLKGTPPEALASQWKGKLPGIATHCNEMQERADEAEREIIHIKLLRYLEDHRQEIFEAVVTGVQEYGLFVRLEDYSIEGLIKVQEMGGDFYKLDERRKALVGTRTGKVFSLGQPVKVTIQEIDMARRQLDLVLAEA